MHAPPDMLDGANMGKITKVITTQQLHSRPNVLTLRSSVFSGSDLMLKRLSLFTLNMTTVSNEM